MRKFFLLLVSFHSRMPIERFTFQLRMESLGRLDASFSVGATQQRRITLLLSSDYLSLQAATSSSMPTILISPRHRKTPTNNTTFPLWPKMISTIFSRSSLNLSKKHQKNFKRISVGCLFRDFFREINEDLGSYYAMVKTEDFHA